MRKSTSPSLNKTNDTQLRESAEGFRTNPATARTNVHYLNFKKNLKERESSKDKFNSIATNKNPGKLLYILIR
jgi:hypothetical protein